jgi:hypothetical protein
MAAKKGRTTYKAFVTEDNGLWQIDLGVVGSTSTRHDCEIDLMAREYISMQENLRPFDFDISFEFKTTNFTCFRPSILESLIFALRG